MLLGEAQDEEGDPGVVEEHQLVSLGQVAIGGQAGHEADGFDEHGGGGLADALRVLQAHRPTLVTVAVVGQRVLASAVCCGHAAAAAVVFPAQDVKQDGGRGSLF